MAVCSESLARLNPIFVDDPECPESHVMRVAVLAERERVTGFQPAEVDSPAVSGFAYADQVFKRCGKSLEFQKRVEPDNSPSRPNAWL
jgi:hypothetical protein